MMAKTYHILQSRKTPFRKWILKGMGIASTAIISLSIVSAANTDQSSPESPAMNIVLKLPTSPQEMWQRLLMLLNTNGGFVSKQQVENVIGVPFSETEKDDEKHHLGAAYLHTYKKEIPQLGLLDMGMFEDPKKISFSVTWGNPASELPSCLEFRKVNQDLQSLGFLDGERSPIPGRPSHVDFSRPETIEQRNRLNDAIDAETDPLEKKNLEKKLFEFRFSMEKISLIVPYNASQCVTGFTMRIPFKK